MELHELLGRAKSDMTMALSYLETALDKTEKEQARLLDRDGVEWGDDVVKINDFIITLEEAICDVNHAIPQIQILMEDL